MTYSYLHLLAKDPHQMIDLLNAHGAKGWRLVSADFRADPQGYVMRWEVVMERRGDEITALSAAPDLLSSEGA